MVKTSGGPGPFHGIDDLMESVPTGSVRVFETGATRDTADGKLDYEGFLSPVVLTAYAEYMHKNRIQSDGTLRDSDNWQKGIPRSAYMKSAWRHFMDVWTAHRRNEPIVEHCLALMFNIMGLVHETLMQGEDRVSGK